MISNINSYLSYNNYFYKEELNNFLKLEEIIEYYNNFFIYKAFNFDDS